MKRIFDKFIKKQFNVWYDRALPVQKYTRLIS